MRRKTYITALNVNDQNLQNDILSSTNDSIYTTIERTIDGKTPFGTADPNKPTNDYLPHYNRVARECDFIDESGDLISTGILRRDGTCQASYRGITAGANKFKLRRHHPGGKHTKKMLLWTRV